MASEMEEFLENVARDVFATSINSIESVQETIPIVLKRRLLPLLEAAADMRYQEWPTGMEHGPAKDWDDALVAAKKG